KLPMPGPESASVQNALVCRKVTGTGTPPSSFFALSGSKYRWSESLIARANSRTLLHSIGILNGFPARPTILLSAISVSSLLSERTWSGFLRGGLLPGPRRPDNQIAVPRPVVTRQVSRRGSGRRSGIIRQRAVPVHHQLPAARRSRSWTHRRPERCTDRQFPRLRRSGAEHASAPPSP